MPENTPPPDPPLMDDRWPLTPRQIAAQIKEHAAARAKAALNHRWNCKCDPCKVRRQKEKRAA